jgi:beta-galactosidase/beta-glucuronidase
MNRACVILDAQTAVWSLAPHVHLPLGQPVPIDDATSWSWLDAEVPGDVMTILKRRRLVPDPMIGFNDETVRWVEWVDWAFRAQISLSADFLDAEAGIDLVLRDVDCHAEVFVNRKRVGGSQQSVS